MHKNRIEKLPVVDRQGRLVALITLKDILNKERFPNANKDKKGRLMVAAAVGPKDLERAKTLVEAEADAIVIDTAHGHSKNVVEAVKIFKKAFDCELIAGNISTAEAAKALIKAGADAVKVGQGAGAICTTRVIAGIGVPQFSAVLAVAKAAEKQAVPVIADGGIKYSGDITKAIAAGASSVMIGSLFAGCEETPGKTVFMYNRKFKQYRGMGSVGAMASGQSQDRYLQEHLKRTGKFVPEGIEGIVPFRGKLEEIVYQLLGGLRSGMGYTGAKTIEELRTKTKWVKVTSAGLRESHPHDVIITEEAPNYQRTAHI
jgi:IMP dehydrogenase